MELHMYGTPNPVKGTRMTGVLQLTHYLDESTTLGYRVPNGEAIFLMNHLTLGRLSIYDALVLDHDDMLYVQLDHDSWFCYADQHPSCHSDKILELCGGFGGMGIGASFLGGQPHVTVDCNPLAVQHLLNNEHGTVLSLNLMELQSARAIHEAFQGQPGTTTLGFPCQPHSSQGMMKGASDDRSQVFWAGLRTIFLCQSQAAIFECVPGAGRSEDVKRGLQALARAMDWTVHSIEIDLRDQWPNRRHRWWALLLPSSWQPVDLQAWPATGNPLTIGDIIQHWGSWPEGDEQDLQLSSFELHMYQDPKLGTENRFLELQDIANTILHSYGNALSGCPCGCRQAAFSMRSLQTKGLRGFFVASRVTGGPRFLHHREAALLLGVPDRVQYGDLPARACLALLGLIASPMQMIWLYSHLKQSAASTFGTDSFPQPMQWLRAYKNELLQQSAHLFQHDEPGILSHVTLTDAEGHRLVIASATSFTVGQLLHAERITLDWNEAGGITLEGNHLPMDTYMDSNTGPFALTADRGPVQRIRPDGLVAIALIHQGNYMTEFLTPGQFLFEALRKADIHVNFLVDAGGMIYGADFRVWRSYRLQTLPNWPPTFPIALHGAGSEPHPVGLHDGHIWHVLQAFSRQSHPSFCPLLIHPRDAFAIQHNVWPIDDTSLLEQHGRSTGQICCIFVSDHHWALLWGEVDETTIEWTYEDGLPAQLEQQAMDLASKLTVLLQYPTWTFGIDGEIQQLDPSTCGAIALCHAASHFGLFGLPSLSHLRRLHSWLMDTSLVGHLYGGGLTQEQMEALHTLLGDHGVPFGVVADRAQQVVQKLGAGPVAEALRAKNSWAYLKALANKPSISLRLVHADELTRHVSQTAKNRFGASIVNAKGKKRQDKKTSQTPAMVDPAMLVLSPGSFRDVEEDDLSQIEFSEVEAEAHGIAICSLEQGEQLLKTTSSISSCPLAILVTEPPSADFMKMFDVIPMTFTATYKGTGEPMIIYGAMKSLGDMKINRVIPKTLERPELVATQVLKIVAYRDEMEITWERFCESPIRALCQLIPRLQLCHGRECGTECNRSHAPVDESFDSILMEIWSRTYSKTEGGKAAPPDAQTFWVFVRVPKSLVSALLQVQCPGIYLEPRSDEKGHDEQYRVIWLPSRSLADAQHACRTCLHALGLVRLRREYGVRVLATNEEAAFKALRPDATFVPTQVQRIFQLFPLPHGLQKAGVQKLLASLDWVAKPLQPGRSSANAMSWHVGASSGPPKNIFTAFDQEVIVTELTKESKPKPPPKYLASNKTQRHLQSEASASASGSATTNATQADPWHSGHSDPWMQWHTQRQPTSKMHIQEVSTKLKDEMQTALRHEAQTLQATAASASAAEWKQAMTTQEQRVQRLETSVQEIQAQNHQFSQWFGTMGQQLKNTDTAIQGIQYTLSTHQNELTGLHSELQQIPEKVGNKLHASLHEELDTRFDRLEAMMNKKFRTE